MSESKRKAGRYFDKESTVYFNKNYKRIKGIYPSQFLRHIYILDMINNNDRAVLDIGCGSGAMLVDLSRKGFDIIGSDISTNMVETSQNIFYKLEGYKTKLLVADIENLPFRNRSLELIICSGVIEYLEEDHKALSEISRIVKHNGIVIITVTNALTPLWMLETPFKMSGVWDKIYSYIKGGTPFPKARLHIPSKLSKLAKIFDLIEIDRSYFHFSPLPVPLNLIFFSLCRNIGLRMEKYSKDKLGFLGRGCILKYKKYP